MAKSPALSWVNVAAWDRGLRLACGALMAFLGWSEILPGLWGAAARVFAFVPLVTGAIGWSPLYAILDFSTVKAFRPPDEPGSHGTREER